MKHQQGIPFQDCWNNALSFDRPYQTSSRYTGGNITFILVIRPCILARTAHRISWAHFSDLRLAEQDLNLRLSHLVGCYRGKKSTGKVHKIPTCHKNEPVHISVGANNWIICKSKRQNFSGRMHRIPEYQVSGVFLEVWRKKLYSDFLPNIS